MRLVQLSFVAYGPLVRRVPATFSLVVRNPSADGTLVVHGGFVIARLRNARNLFSGMEDNTCTVLFILSD